MKTIHFLGYESGIAAADPGCADGPGVLKQSPYINKLKDYGVHYQWDHMFQPNIMQPTKFGVVSELCQNIASTTSKLVNEKQFFLSFGGDHSCAIGTWSGAQHGLQTQGELGLIWIDAHMDSHTPETSHSGNIHGMPVACLLGFGEKSLTHILNPSSKIKPEHLCLIGIRSFEPEEEAFLKKHHVRIITMAEVKERGMDDVLQEALAIVNTGTAGYGITIDIDSIDPKDAPGTGVAEPDGILAGDLCEALKSVANDPRLIGAEIVEFDPHRDQHQKTEKLISQLVSVITLGKELHD